MGVGTVYRRFASKDALIDELLRLALEEILSATGRALARTDGHGLEELLRAFGQSFADHARYASLLLQRRTDDVTAGRIRAAIDELTARAITAGTINPGITPGDVLALTWAMRGLVQAAGDVAPGAWQRFLDIQLAGMRAARAAEQRTPPLIPAAVGAGPAPGQIRRSGTAQARPLTARTLERPNGRPAVADRCSPCPIPDNGLHVARTSPVSRACPRTVRTKLRMMSPPQAVRIDSGWNCRPSAGCRAWRSPMGIPPGPRAVITRSGGRDFSSTIREW